MPSSLWPLPSTPARPTISPRRTDQGEVVEPHARRRRRCTVEAVAHAGRSRFGAHRRRRRRPAPRRRSASATSSGAQLARRPWPAPARADVGVGHASRRRPRRPRAQHGDAVGDLGDLGELVRHQHDGAAASATRRQMSSRRADLAGRQHGGRLVEHQQLRLAHQALRRSRRAGARRPRGRRPRASGSSVEAEAPRRCRGMRRAELVALQHAPRPGRASGSRPRSCRGTRLKCWCTMAMPLRQRLGRAGGRERRAVEAHVARASARRRRRPCCTGSTCRRRSRPAGSGPRRRATSRRDVVERLQAAEALAEIASSAAARGCTPVRRRGRLARRSAFQHLDLARRACPS